jgi:hypothetical protein
MWDESNIKRQLEYADVSDIAINMFKSDFNYDIDDIKYVKMNIDEEPLTSKPYYESYRENHDIKPFFMDNYDPLSEIDFYKSSKKDKSKIDDIRNKMRSNLFSTGQEINSYFDHIKTELVNYLEVTRTDLMTSITQIERSLDCNTNQFCMTEVVNELANFKEKFYNFQRGLQGINNK